MIQQVEQLLVLLNKVNFQDDRKKQQIQIVLKELTSDYLPMHLRKYACQSILSLSINLMPVNQPYACQLIQ